MEDWGWGWGTVVYPTIRLLPAATVVMIPHVITSLPTSLRPSDLTAPPPPASGTDTLSRQQNLQHLQLGSERTHAFVLDRGVGEEGVHFLLDFDEFLEEMGVFGAHFTTLRLVGVFAGVDGVSEGEVEVGAEGVVGC